MIASILASLGEDPGRVITSARSDENKGKLRRATEEAVERGIFGAPSFISGDELFWGNDRLEDALKWQKSLTGVAN